MPKAASWTRSETLRREQGHCRPPVGPANQTPRYLVPAGVSGHYRRMDELIWRPYVTRQASGFERFEHIENGCPVFRSGGYVLKVDGKVVIQRDVPPVDFSRLAAARSNRRGPCLPRRRPSSHRRSP